MLLKRNLLETVTLTSSCGAAICILLNYVTNISPITGVWFLIYILTLFVVSVYLSIKVIQWLLHLNRPIKYDLEGWVEQYPLLSCLRGVLPQVRVREKEECKEYDTNELSVISTVLERKLVSSWYIPYISEEIGFPFACKQLLDQMINKAFQICHKIETKDVYVDMCAVLITHLKEYKKALKRHEKSQTSTIESLYKKTHSIFDPEKKLTSADHCVNILRIILKELVPWELWDTPHSELLIRVLAKKLDNFIDNILSEPVWLNDRLFMILKKKENEVNKQESKAENLEHEVSKQTDEVTKTEIVKEQTPPPVTNPEPSVSEVPKPAVSNEVLQEVPEENNVVEETAVSEPVEIKPSAVLRQRRGRQGRNEVKIYDRIIEGSVKTWETDMDLQCISLGQDLLASLDEMTLSRLWGQEDAEHSPNLRTRSPQPLWFGEEDTIDIDQAEQSETKDVKKENSPKPTEALFKDIQSTVNQAKTKIGDLQVPLDIDVPCKHSSDEAAGVMEGLLDMGLAGIKKGLRFTGLSDDSQEKSPSHSKDRTTDKTSPPDSARSSQPKTAPEQKDAFQVQQKEENGSSVPPLVKQHRVISQDSVPQVSQAMPPRAELPAALMPLSDSPEPEYEEVADLSTSIAKLRSLLQDAGNARSEEIWWEGAEETRGRTHHGHNYTFSRPVDTATLADEYDMSGEPNSSPRQTSNNMQRLDKLFHRTVTGMFNSIKTAVSAEEELLLQPPADWTYIMANSVDNSVCGAIARLVAARRTLRHVDAALDSLSHLPPSAAASASRPPQPLPDDLEEWMAGEGAAWCALSETGSAAGLPRSHLACRLATLLLADLGESLISTWLDELTAWLRTQIFVVFEQMSAQDTTLDFNKDALRKFDLDETCTMLIGKVPDIYIFGEDAVTEAVRLAVSSFSQKEINKEVIFRFLDLFAVHFKKSASLRNSSFDNN